MYLPGKTSIKILLNIPMIRREIMIDNLLLQSSGSFSPRKELPIRCPSQACGDDLEDDRHFGEGS